MSDASEDEDLARAIALSIDEARRSKQLGETSSNQGEVDSAEERFQADLRAAIAASQAEPPRPRSTSPATSVTSSADSPSPAHPLLSNNVPPSSAASDPSTSSASTAYTTAAFISERGQLEQARLARLKRYREQNGQTEDERGPTKRQTPSPVEIQNPAKGKQVANMRGWIFDGSVRPTANRFVNPGKNGEDGHPVWRLSEIIVDKSDIELAILSAYVVDPSWIYQFFNLGTPVVLVAQPSTQESSRTTVKQILPHWIRVTPAFRGAGYGVMHIKLMLLFYKTGRLRIVIPTANFVPYDWRDIENSVFVQDIPKRSSPIPHDPTVDDFASRLEHVLRTLNVDAGLRAQIQTDHPDIPVASTKPGTLRQHWDFSRVTSQLIASLNGKHEGWPSVVKTGHTALMKAVRDLAGITSKRGRRVSVECQGSSIGNYNTKWLNEIYGSFMGENPEVWLDQPKSRRDKLPFPDIKVLFPTFDHVKQTVLGEQGGGTLFCRKNQWNNPRFPRDLFYQSRSRRGPSRVVMHSKMIIAIFSDSPKAGLSTLRGASEDVALPSEKSAIGWAYVGSHNFTPSAWGTLSGSAFNPILNISNYELGVVIPLYSEAEIDDLACFERPPRKYAPEDKPWMQEDSEHFRE